MGRRVAPWNRFGGLVFGGARQSAVDVFACAWGSTYLYYTIANHHGQCVRVQICSIWGSFGIGAGYIDPPEPNDGSRANSRAHSMHNLLLGLDGITKKNGKITGRRKKRDDRKRPLFLQSHEKKTSSTFRSPTRLETQPYYFQNELKKISPWKNLPLKKSPVQKISPWKNLPLENSPLGKISPWKISPWKNLPLEKSPLEKISRWRKSPVEKISRWIVTLFSGKKVFKITADFQKRWWQGHEAQAKIMTVESQMSTRSA